MSASSSSSSEEEDDPRFKSVVVDPAKWSSYIKGSAKGKKKAANGDRDADNDRGFDAGSYKHLINIMFRAIESKMSFEENIWPKDPSKKGKRKRDEDADKEDSSADVATEGIIWCTPHRPTLQEIEEKTRLAKKKWKKDSANEEKKKKYKKLRKRAQKIAEKEKMFTEKRAALAHDRRLLTTELESQRKINAQREDEKRLCFQEWFAFYRERRRKERRNSKAAKKAGKAINTLFAVGFPFSYTEEQAKSMFVGDGAQGFEALSFNQKEGKAPIAFVRFSSAELATEAMRRLQGFKFVDDAMRSSGKPSVSTLRLAFAKYELASKRGVGR